MCYGKRSDKMPERPVRRALSREPHRFGRARDSVPRGIPGTVYRYNCMPSVKYEAIVESLIGQSTPVMPLQLYAVIGFGLIRDMLRKWSCRFGSIVLMCGDATKLT